MRRLRVYIDTSVLGAVFDDEFREPTTAFFEQAHEGRFDIVLSALVEDEIFDAPQDARFLWRRYRVRGSCDSIPPGNTAAASLSGRRNSRSEMDGRRAARGNGYRDRV